MSNQLIRSGTSIGANLMEGKYAESDADFVHKLRISRKECAETIFWLEILAESEIVDERPRGGLPRDGGFLRKGTRELTKKN